MKSKCAMCRYPCWRGVDDQLPAPPLPLLRHQLQAAGAGRVLALRVRLHAVRRHDRVRLRDRHGAVPRLQRRRRAAAEPQGRGGHQVALRVRPQPRARGGQGHPQRELGHARAGRQGGQRRAAGGAGGAGAGVPPAPLLRAGDQAQVHGEPGGLRGPGRHVPGAEGGLLPRPPGGGGPRGARPVRVPRLRVLAPGRAALLAGQGALRAAADLGRGAGGGHGGGGAPPAGRHPDLGSLQAAVRGVDRGGEGADAAPDRGREILTPRPALGGGERAAGQSIENIQEY